MAVNVTVFDLLNNPNNPKQVIVDLASVVPLGNGGEDAYVLTSSTSATASGAGGTSAIQKLYIRDTRIGWAKSSGLKTGPYAVTGSKKHLKVAIDEDTGVEIMLAQSVTPITGEAVAEDLQTKINNLAKTGGSKVGNLSYLNATVRYINGRFEILSGTSGAYTGVDRSSVAVTDGITTTGLLAELGFDISITSQALAGNAVGVTSLASGYVSGTSMTVTTAGVVSSGDAIVITDGTNTAYRGVTTANGTTLTLSSGIGTGFAAGSMVQVLGLRDFSAEPPPIYTDIDDLMKYAITYIANQINFL